MSCTPHETQIDGSRPLSIAGEGGSVAVGAGCHVWSCLGACTPPEDSDTVRHWDCFLCNYFPGPVSHLMWRQEGSLPPPAMLQPEITRPPPTLRWWGCV